MNNERIRGTRGESPWHRIITFSLVLAMMAAILGLAPCQAIAQEQGQVPGAPLGAESDADLWRALRNGEAGQVAGPHPQAGVMIQSEGDLWRAMRNGPLSTFGVYALIGIIGVLALFFLLRGRIRIDGGPSDQRIQRFDAVERAIHWLTATTFVILAITGLNLLYGRYLLIPLLGPEIFAQLTVAGKYAHNYLAFGFMIGLALMVVLWLVHNLPNRHDLIWLLKGGGMFMKGVHPPAKKFNAGQKILFWLVALGGLSLSLSGIALMFPFQFTMFAETFATINGWFGTSLPTALSPIQEQQYAQLWHGLVGLFMTAVIIGHIYIGSIGMEGAFDAMGSGDVDLNWAREHHSLWVEDLERKGHVAAQQQGGDD